MLMKTLTAFASLFLLALTLAAPAAARPNAAVDPTTAAQVDMPVTLAAGDYSLLGFVLDLPTGAGFAAHVHGGPVAVMVVEGVLTLQENGAEHTVRAGETFLEPVGHQHAVINRGEAKCRIAGAELLPKGAADTTLIGPVGMPATGAGLGAQPTLWVLAVSLLLLAAGLLARGRRLALD